MIPSFNTALSQLIAEFACVPDATAVAYTKHLQSLFIFMNEIHYFFLW